jgi:phospholipase C
MKRRDALKTIGGLGAAAGVARLLPACGGSGAITHYVYMMMENRSYDHFFGARSMIEKRAGNGLSMDMFNLDLDGVKISPWKPDLNQLCDPDPPHGWDALHASWNNGANDGFVVQHQMAQGNRTAIEPMQYLVRDDVPVSWYLADQYATADHWHCAVMGPTWPNRFYWHAASSEGKMANTLPEGMFLTEPSIYHRLDDKGIDWAYYFGNVSVVSLYQGLDPSRIKRFEDFLGDAAAGRLPPVTYIDPAFNDNDDHPPVHPINGQALISTVYNALARSPHWKNCLFVITYDENGGFFDHVSPPKTVDVRASVGFDQLGFRVPTLVAGPYVKRGYVSSVPYEHCSALRHLELAFDLEPLNARTQAASDLSDFIDADRLASGEWAPPVQLPAVDPTNAKTWPMSAVCDAGTIPGKGNAAAAAPGSHPILDWARSNPPALAGMGPQPRDTTEYHRAIREFLARTAREPVE